MDILLKTIGSINDETRIKILHFININGEVCVCDIENSFYMIQSRVSRHLKILKDGGFLRVDRKGRWAYYSVRTPLDKFRQNILEEISHLDLNTPELNRGCKVQNKKVLIMCTGNSCRSIIGEALINSKLEGVDAYSCGVAPSGRVNPNAKKILEQNGDWSDSYFSKHLDEVIDMEFDLVVTVCGNADETCPSFPRPVKRIHVGFEDPDGKEFSAFEETYKEINDLLLRRVKTELNR
ncbi:MAG: metalloregulator ArsR/SmtB family transcription factor [Sulfurimonas sp.]|nr:metalloregulator ArsR/SmtB family transcription factor [Sulfurimonas sp.]